MRKSPNFILLLSTLFLLTSNPISMAGGVEKTDYIIKFVDNANLDSEIEVLKTSQGIDSSRTFRNVFKGGVFALNEAQAAALSRNPKIEIIEKDAFASISQTIDSANGDSWGLDRIDQLNLPLDKAYEYPAPSKSSTSVKAYVVDTGINSSHQDFTGRITSGINTTSGSLSTEDCNGHGTHVAGIIGGTRFGVAKQVILVPVRVLGCSGSGTISGIIAGLDWIGKQSNAISSVVNMSLGGGVSPSLDKAVISLATKGFKVVVAAGNSNADACNYSPSRVESATVVAASNINDRKASFSNYGKCVDIIAPGVDIPSDYKGTSTAIATLSGTSMASPFVAGAIARYISSGQTVTLPSSLSGSVTIETLPLLYVAPTK